MAEMGNAPDGAVAKPLFEMGVGDLELGEGWAFVGRQKEVIIAGKTRKVDLLFYHIYLRCYVVLELYGAQGKRIREDNRCL